MANKPIDTDLLIIDDFGIRSLDKQQMLDFMELMEDRHGMKSTIIISQLPVANWYDMMKVNSTAAIPHHLPTDTLLSLCLASSFFLLR